MSTLISSERTDRDIKNIILALIMTAIVYTILIHFDQKPSWLPTWVFVTGIFLISYPWRIGKDVFSLWGGWAEGNVFSLFGFVQNAGVDAFSVVGIYLYQIAGHDADHVFGISLYQRAGNSARQGITLSFYQEATRHNAYLALGISLYQNAGNNATQLFSLSFIQRSYDFTFQFIGISVFQNSMGVVLHCGGISIIQMANEETSQAFGLSFVQISETHIAKQGIGVVLFQRGGRGTEQLFGIRLIHYNTKPFH